MTTEATQEPRLHVFHCTNPYMQVISPTGRKIIFIQGAFYTKHPEEIEFLQGMTQDPERGIYTNSSQLTILESERNPMQALRNKMRAELLAEMQAQLNPENDRGKSEQGRLNPASTVDVAAVAAGGDATSLHARVAKLVPGATK